MMCVSLDKSISLAHNPVRRRTVGDTWQLSDAKQRLGEVIEQAIRNGPQVITRRGVETAVLISYADYRKLLLRQKKLSEFFRESPLVGVDLDLTRHRDG